MRRRGSVRHLSLVLVCLLLVGNLSRLETQPVEAEPNDYVPLKWAVVVVGGYNYYRDLTYNSIQRIEKIMQGRGVPYDVFQDDDIVAPTDSSPTGKYALQYANGTLKYQVVVLLFDYDLAPSACVNQIYIDWAVGNGTNAVLFNRVAMAVPELLGLTTSDIIWSYGGLITSNIVYRTFNDEIKEYIQGSVVALGAPLYFHAIIHESIGMTVWFNKTWTSNWSLGMLNTTYGYGDVWYLGYSLNDFAMEFSSAQYPTSWADRKMDFWGHAINFAFNNAQQINVGILPYKQWKGAWVIRVDTDTMYWKSAFLPPESVLQSGWIYDYQFCVLGYGRTQGIDDLALTSGAPSGYSGIPSSQVMHTSITGVLQTDFTSESYVAIIYNSTEAGAYDRIKLDFNENMDFADDIEYRMWENMTYLTVQGKLYWCKISPDAEQPQRINVAWWQTPMLMQNEETNLPIWRGYGANYSLTYSFHGWQHVYLEPGGSSYVMWNGTRFLLDTTYIEEKFDASRCWMKDKFGGTGYGFEEDYAVISHPGNNHPTEVDSVIDSLPWVLFQYDGANAYVGFGLKSATSKYLLVSANEERFHEYSRFAAIEDMVRTLYPVISTFAHGLQYNTTFSFPPYSDSITPANPRDAFNFWLGAKYMLESTANAYYKSDRITLEFRANSTLQDYVWKFPVEYNGRLFNSFSDNRSIGQIEHEDEDYIYIEFSQGQGAQKLELTYGAVHNIAITDVASSKTVVGETFTLNIDVTIANQGNYTETFQVSAYANTTLIDAETITLGTATSTNATFTWDTTGFTRGNYILSVTAAPVPGETDTADNDYTDGMVHVTIPGDVNGDKMTNVIDLTIVGFAYGQLKGETNYDAEADITSDDIVDMRDMVIVARNLGKTG